MNYHNPVIPGFYPDPSVCRVGEGFYLVNSSFEYFPGVPIWHSRDLIHWRQLGHVLTRRSQLELAGVRCSDGIYAPTLRYHQGFFYMITTLVSSGTYRNFWVIATDPAGPWSDPVWFDQSGIDPSLFFDEDGRVYFQSNRGMTFKMERAIYQSEVDLPSGRRLTEPVIIWRGSGGSYVEGPHIYRREGWYYLLTAEGGTSYGHMVAVARSRNIWGDFEACPHNPILSNRHAYENLHGTGHADLVQAADGTWWMVHLAFRKTVGDVHTLGRETCLTPVTWCGGWPIVNHTGTTAEAIEATTLPLHPWPEVDGRDDFDTPVLGMVWIQLRNPEMNNYSLTDRPGFLRLRGVATSLFDLASPTLVARRQQHFEFTAGTRLEFEPGTPQEEAGMALLMTNEHHYDFCVTSRAGQRVLQVRYHLELIWQTAVEIPLTSGPLDLKITGSREHYRFSFSQSGQDFREIARVNTRYLGTEVTGGYNGVVIALYATGHGGVCSKPADFDWFDYQPQGGSE